MDQDLRFCYSLDEVVSYSAAGEGYDELGEEITENLEAELDSFGQVLAGLQKAG